MAKEIYICPKCGAEMYLNDEKGYNERVCPRCNNIVDEEEFIRCFECGIHVHYDESVKDKEGNLYCSSECRDGY